MEKKYQIFISSTFEDLQEERNKVKEAILDLGCFPAGMENFPAGNEDQFEYIKGVMDESDFVVVISGDEYGSLTEDGVGYTEKEYSYAIDNHIPLIAMLKKNYTPKETGKKKKLLDNFRDELKKNRMVKFWDNKDELKTNVITGLLNLFKQYNQPGWVKGGENDTYRLPTIFLSSEEPKDAKADDIWVGGGNLDFGDEG